MSPSIWLIFGLLNGCHLTLTQEDKKKNQQLASERVGNENVIGMLKRFNIISDTYTEIEEKDSDSDLINLCNL